jgi:hypothetical protein
VSTATSLEPPSSSAKSGPNGTAVVEMYAQLSKNVVELKTLLSIYEKENFSVFFDAVPSTREQLQVPTEGKSIVKADPFSVRDSWSVSLLPTAGDKCCVM